MRPAGCSTARRARIVAPSFEIVTSCESWSKSSSQARKRRPTPMLSTSILSRPRGPKDDLTMFAIVCAATTNSVLSNHERLLEKPQFRTYHSDHGCPGRILCPLRGRHRLLDRAGTCSSLLRGKGIIQRAQSALASLRQCGVVRGPWTNPDYPLILLHECPRVSFSFKQRSSRRQATASFDSHSSASAEAIHW